MKNVKIEGHRGWCSNYPENTIISFEAAIKKGVDSVEFDVWLTKDKVPVLIHDGNCMRTCGKYVHVNDLTLEEVKQLDAGYPDKFGDKFTGKGITIATLEELLQLVKELNPKMSLGVEIKEYTEECVDITVALLKKYGLFEQCFFYAFHHDVIKYIFEKYNGFTMGYPDFQMRNFQPGGYNYYNEIGMSMALVRSEIFEVYASKGFKMHLYCADTEDEVNYLIEKGASYITCNDIEPMLKVLGRWTEE